MKKAKSTVTPDETLAARWRCDERTVRRWRKSGAPLDDEARMWTWLAGQRTLPRGTAELRSEHRREAKAQVSGKPQLSAPTAEGAGAALKRLEAAEARAHAELLAAEAAGDLFAKRAAEASWLKISGSLLRYDVAVESARRDSGAMIERAIVEKAFRHFGAALRIALPGTFKALTPVIAHSDMEQVGRALQRAGDSLAGALARLFVGSPSELPAFATDSFTQGFDFLGKTWTTEQQEPIRQAVEFLFAMTFEQARAEMDSMRQMLAEGSESEVREFRVWRARQQQEQAEQRRRFCTDAAAAGRPVPNATDDELREIPGLSRG